MARQLGADGRERGRWEGKEGERSGGLSPPLSSPCSLPCLLLVLPMCPVCPSDSGLDRRVAVSSFRGLGSRLFLLLVPGTFHLFFSGLGVSRACPFSCLHFLSIFNFVW